MNSIKLTYDQYEQFESELNPSYFGTRPISMKVKARGIFPSVTRLHIKNDGTGMILSNEPFESPKLEGEAAQRLLKAMDKRVKGPDFPEVMVIFNELLEWWYQSEQTIIHDRSVKWDEDQKELEKDKADFIKRFKEALGVE